VEDDLLEVRFGFEGLLVLELADFELADFSEGEEEEGVLEFLEEGGDRGWDWDLEEEEEEEGLETLELLELDDLGLLDFLELVLPDLLLDLVVRGLGLGLPCIGGVSGVAMGLRFLCINGVRGGGAGLLVMSARAFLRLCAGVGVGGVEMKPGMMVFSDRGRTLCQTQE
jgi:hypothetical protein